MSDGSLSDFTKLSQSKSGLYEIESDRKFIDKSSFDIELKLFCRGHTYKSTKEETALKLIQKSGPLGTLVLMVLVLLVPSQIEKAVEAWEIQLSSSSQQSSVSAQSASSQWNDFLRSGAVQQMLQAAVPESMPLPWNLILVNDWNRLDEAFTVALIPVEGGEKVDYRIQEPLEQMIAAASEDGVSLMICSGYRDIDYQKNLYQKKTDGLLAAGLPLEYAQREASHWVARPGCSEHHTGLAVDIVTPAYQVLDSGFAETEAAKWLLEHAPTYGFILRYPADKTEITGVAWEPWHYRYVGTEYSESIVQKGICLEELLQEFSER